MVSRIEGKHSFGLRRARLMGNGLEQLLLAVEIDVERPFRDPSLARDLAHARGIEALGQKHLACAVHDLASLGVVLMLRRRRRFRFDQTGIHGSSHSHLNELADRTVRSGLT